MRRLLTPVALLAAASLLASAASAATGHRAASAGGARAATATFQDATGEKPDAPDITTITVSCDDAGVLTFQIAIPNRPIFAPDMELIGAFDSDADPSTGASDGTDYLITASPDVDSGTTIGVHPWVGDDSFGFNKDYPSALAWADGVATITLNRSALGGTGKFSFQFSALSGIDPSSDNMDNVVSDDAPNDGFYSFDTGLQPIAQPVATRLLVTDSLLVPAKPKAGKAAVFAVLLRTDVDTVPTDGSVTCRATAGKKALKAKIGTMIEGGAACGWMIPKGTKGKMLRGSLTVKVQKLKLTKSFAVRIG